MIPYTVVGSFPLKAEVKADSGLTYANNFQVSRKRIRESINPMMTWPSSQIQNGNRVNGSFTYLGEDISLTVQQQHLETNQLIAQHMEKLRVEIGERRKRHCRRIVAAIEQGIANKLKAKDSEIERIWKLNWELEEKVKSLTVEGQIWRDLATTKEAQAESLRANLDEVHVFQAWNACRGGDDITIIEDDAQSCCGSSGGDTARKECSTGGIEKMCRHCGKKESKLLMLPCRHLCLCTVCGSSVHTCPVCNTPKNASIQVIMSV